MRLLRTDTLQLVEFMGDFDGRYAILSHTWGREEISFQEMVLANKSTQPEADAVKEKAGYRKIRGFAAVAAEDGHEYAWVDTCCIDKSSSAELSEAINSMFRWYRNAAHCYVYLADISDKDADADLATRTSRLNLNSRRGMGLELCHSRWFTRGWTLQELVAPVSLRFYLFDWTAGPTREDLSNQLESIIKIPAEVLETGEFSEIPVAERLKWASNRVTTRVEDMAYCLMGLFDVNMPLLYGEGHKAFLRLQEEIYRNTNDESIFAWTSSSNQQAWFDDHQYRGLFARSPAEFG
ncbi:heterokaryon incompatibility protein-domain-containing protein, partial [Immersiella caudata]